MLWILSSDILQIEHMQHAGPHQIKFILAVKNGEGSPYSIAECRVLELIPVLDSQPAGDMSHKPGGRLPLLSARPEVNFQASRPVPVSLLGEQRHDGYKQFA